MTDTTTATIGLPVTLTFDPDDGIWTVYIHLEEVPDSAGDLPDEEQARRFLEVWSETPDARVRLTSPAAW